MTPIEFYLHDTFTPEWKFIRPILVCLELDENGTYIVSEKMFLEYGCGPDIGSAKMDYAANLISYYSFLSDRRDDADVEYVFRQISKYLVPVEDNDDIPA